MEPHLQGIEIQAVSGGDHDLAVNDASVGQLRDQDLVQLGKVAIERLEVAALDEELGAVAKDNGAKAIPLGLEQEVAFAGNRICDLGEHRFDRWRDGERHSKGPGPKAKGPGKSLLSSPTVGRRITSGHPARSIENGFL